MRKQKKTVYKVLTKEELSAFFNVCDNFKFRTIFMLVYGSGLRIGEVANLREEDIDSKKMRIFVRAGKGNKERYTILPKQSLVDCKEPFNNAESVIKYLGRYTHRVAISNERIVKVEEDKVTFKWRDYKDNNKMKEMTITIEEFIRRFLIHILPPKFMKIRYYGILGNRNKKKKLLKCKILTRTKVEENNKKLPILELLKKTLGKDFNLCPNCKKGHMLMPNTT